MDSFSGFERRDQFVGVEPKVAEDDLTFGVDQDEPRRPAAAIIFHDSGMSLAIDWHVVAEWQSEIVLALHLAQSFWPVMRRAFKYGLDNRKSNAIFAQRIDHFLERRKAERMAAGAPMLKTEYQLIASAK
ncbi:MAG: hypothetical protein AAFY07_00870, partial [Pseudomonadota bacterium]